MSTKSTSDNETYQQLLEQISILEAASSAIKKLTMKLNGQRRVSGVSIESITSQADSDDQASNTPKTVPCSDNPIFRFQGPNQRTRGLGYVNWNTTHDKLAEKLELVQMIEIRKALKKLRDITPTPSTPNQQTGFGSSHNQQIAVYNSVQQNQANKGNGLFVFDHTKIDKEYRFPQDAVYVNIKSPRIQVEMQFLAKLFVPPTDGVIDRFLKIVETEMYTCDSFEKENGLKWV